MVKHGPTNVPKTGGFKCWQFLAVKTRSFARRLEKLKRKKKTSIQRCLLQWLWRDALLIILTTRDVDQDFYEYMDG